MADFDAPKAELRRTPPGDVGSVISLTLAVTDPEVVYELQQRKGEERNRYAMTALRVGVLALRQAGGFVDAQKLQNEGERLVTEVDVRLREHAAKLDERLKSELKQYFDPSNGHFHERVKALVSEDGELARRLREHVSGDASLLARQLAETVGKDSPLMRYFAVGEKGGLIETLTRIAQERLEEQSRKVLGEFDLNNEKGALKRLVTQIETNFNPHDPKTALGVLKTALESTQEQIRRDLSLDKDDSALSNLHSQLKKQINELLERQQKFQTDVSTVLAELRGARQERAVSPSGGFDFEGLAGEALRARMDSSDVFESVGETTGLVPRSKVGDHVQTLGAETAAAGAAVVYECKRSDSYTLAGALAELETARRNRGADVGVFVVAASSLRDNARMQAEFPRPLTRQGNDIVVIWDHEDAGSDVNLDAAVTLARALAVRSRGGDSPESDADWEAIDKAINGVERQIEYFENLNTWCGNIKRDAGKIEDRVEKMKRDLQREIERLAEELAALRR